MLTLMLINFLVLRPYWIIIQIICTIEKHCVNIHDNEQIRNNNMCIHCIMLLCTMLKGRLQTVFTMRVHKHRNNNSSGIDGYEYRGGYKSY